MKHRVERRLSPFPQPSAGHQFTLRDHRYRAIASRGVPVLTASHFSSVLIAPTHRWLARLSFWPN